MFRSASKRVRPTVEMQASWTNRQRSRCHGTKDNVPWIPTHKPRNPNRWAPRQAASQLSLCRLSTAIRRIFHRFLIVTRPCHTRIGAPLSPRRSMRNLWSLSVRSPYFPVSGVSPAALLITSPKSREPSSSSSGVSCSPDSLRMVIQSSRAPLVRESSAPKAS